MYINGNAIKLLKERAETFETVASFGKDAEYGRHALVSLEKGMTGLVVQNGKAPSECADSISLRDIAHPTNVYEFDLFGNGYQEYKMISNESN